LDLRIGLNKSPILEENEGFDAIILRLILNTRILNRENAAGEISARND
jgi:hypothetical protein